MNVAAVIVTRGNVALAPIIESLPHAWEPIVWNNSLERDLSVYGRYAAIEHTSADVIFVQDDDCILAPESFQALLDAYTPGHVVANMPARFRPHYPDSCLVGFGAIFDRDLPAQAFGRFAGYDGPSDLFWRAIAEQPAPFLRECDAVFTTLTPRILLDLDYQDREFASDPDRLWRQPDHHAQRQRMLALARQVRDRVPA